MAPNQRPKIVMLKWHEFAKKYQQEKNLRTYTEALQQATGDWKDYKESFSRANPSYDRDGVLQWERRERERKIASGELKPPKPRSRKSAPAVVAPHATHMPHQTKNTYPDSDDDYDVIIKETVTKKRKRPSGGSSSTPSVPNQAPPKKVRKRAPSTAKAAPIPNGVSGGEAALPNKRKRTIPVKKAEPQTMSEASKRNKKVLPLPTARAAKGVGKAGAQRGRLTETTYPDMEDEIDDGDFPEELDDRMSGDEVSSGQMYHPAAYAEDVFA